MTRSRLIPWLALGALGACATADAQVLWRAQRPPVVGEVVNVSSEGVTVKAAEGEGTRLIGWQSVRAVEGPLATPAARFTPDADALWRIEQRVARGDYRLTEMVAEPRYRAMVEGGRLAGPSAALVAEAVLRCRLARGFTTGAIIPALDLARAVQGVDTSAWIGWSPRGVEVQDPRWREGPVIDTATLLCPWTPPIFERSQASRGLVALLETKDWVRLRGDVGSAGEAGVIAELYRWAVEAEVQDRPAGAEIDLPGRDSEHPGVKVVRWVLESRYGSETQRRAARTALLQKINEEIRRQALDESAASGDSELSANVPPRWLEAWCRMAVGRSLLVEADAALKRQGVIQLLHVPARFADRYPSLAILSLRLAESGLREMGDATGAGSLRAEIVRIDPVLGRAEEPASAPMTPSPSPSSAPMPQPVPSDAAKPR